MSRQFWFNLWIMVLGLFAACVILFAFVTQIFLMDFIAIQWLYEILDRKGGIIRTIIMILIFLAGVIVIIIYRYKLPSKKLSIIGISMIIIGLVLGLSIIYTASCCDNPVFFLLGFPLSWLRGTAQAQHYLPLPMMQYLVQNFGTIKWHIEFFIIFVDSLFWYSVGIIAYMIWPKDILTGASKRTLSE